MLQKYFVHMRVKQSNNSSNNNYSDNSDKNDDNNNIALYCVKDNVYIWMLMSMPMLMPRCWCWYFQMVIIMCRYITLATPLEKSSVLPGLIVLINKKKRPFELKRSFEHIWTYNFFCDKWRFSLVLIVINKFLLCSRT